MYIFIIKMKPKNNSLFYKTAGLGWIGNRRIKWFITRDSLRSTALDFCVRIHKVGC